MSPLDLFWLFFIFAMLQPVVRRYFLDASRQRLIARIEHKHNSRVILLVHRQEVMSFLGFPLFRFIDVNDSEQVLRAIHLTDPEIPLDLILHTPGGLVLASLQIARAIRKHKGKVTVYIPHYAMSGGTLIALAADEIVMSEHAMLGPIDPSVGQFPAVSVLKVIRDKPIAKINDNTLILADQAEKAIKQMQQGVSELLDGRMPKEQLEQLVQLLTEGNWTHDYAITFEEAKRLGFPVRADMPDLIFRLMALFPQPVRQHPSVEYLPTPRRLRN